MRPLTEKAGLRSRGREANQFHLNMPRLADMSLEGKPHGGRVCVLFPDVSQAWYTADAQDRVYFECWKFW